MNKHKELAKNTLLLAIGKLSTQLIAFFLIPVYTFYLSTKDFGLFDLITTYITLAIPVVTLQLELAAFRFLVDVRENEIEKSKIISNIIKIDFLIAVAFSVILIVINCFVHIPYFWIILANIIVSIFAGLFLQISRGLGKNKKYAIASTITSFAILLFTLLSTMLFKSGLSGIFAASVFANIICLIYLGFSLKIGSYFKIGKIGKIDTKNYLRYSAPLVPNGVSWWAVNVSGRTIISIMINVAANGIYAIASKFPAIFMSIFNIFNMSWTESISMHIDSEDKDNFISDIFNLSLKFFSSLGLLIIAIMPVVFTFFVEKSYSSAINYIPIMIIGVVFNSLVSLYGSIYVAKKLTKKVATTSIYSAIISVLLTIALIPLFGLYGAAIATCLAYILMAYLRHKDIKKYAGIKYNIRSIAVIVVSYIIVTAGLYISKGEINNISSLSMIFAILAALYLNAEMTSFIFKRKNN